MGWFSAAIIYESKMDGRAYDDSLRECSVRILLADSEEAAWTRAEEVGRKNEHSYLNSDGETVSWVFCEVGDVQELYEDSLADGDEVFSRMWRTKQGMEAEAFYRG